MAYVRLCVCAVIVVVVVKVVLILVVVLVVEVLVVVLVIFLVLEVVLVLVLLVNRYLNNFPSFHVQYFKCVRVNTACCTVKLKYSRLHDVFIQY